MALQEELEVQGNLLFRYRGSIPLIFIALAIWAFVGQRNDFKSEGITFGDSIYWYLYLAISLFGLFIRVYSVGHAGRNTSGRNTKGQVADSLNTTGIYSVVRHPLYVGNFLMWLGVALLSRNVWFIVGFIFIYGMYYERIMYAEEQFLRGKFGQEYLTWASITPAFFPSFKRMSPPRNPFCVRKVLKQEITGLLLIFFMFLFFDELSEFLASGRIGWDWDFWLVTFISTGIAYLIIKFLQKKTLILKV